MSRSSEVDAEIAAYLSKGASKNFFLYAGAGSGKTSSLIAALLSLRETRGVELSARGARIGVVTYTNAATEEIKKRLGQDSLVDVSTIHSFAWALVKDFPADISAWLGPQLEEETAEYVRLEAKGRAGTKASIERLRKIARNTRILEELPSIRRFSYSPTQTKLTRGGLSHSQVLKVATFLLNERPLFRAIMVGKYPVLLVDEVQDTNKDLMGALLAVSQAHEESFALGLFGDTMQRIYNDGKVDLETSLSETWERPEKLTNFRSAKRIVSLVNQIRSSVDGREQVPSDFADEGEARLFLANSETADRNIVETSVRMAMASVTGDDHWSEVTEVKTLILEHSMAAQRLGFEEFLAAFSVNSDVRASVTSREAIQSGNIHFLGSQVLPIASALRANDSFAADRLLRAFSPLLKNERHVDSREARLEMVNSVRSSVAALSALWASGETVTIGQVIRVVSSSNLLELPTDFEDIVAVETGSATIQPDAGSEADEDLYLSAWSKAFTVDLDQFARFYRYVIGDSSFDTHQGVKGLEFPRVLVILDDENAGGFLFSYEKLFEVTPLSSRDLDHKAADEETTVDRTRRLFYVACSRARNSVAVLMYSSDPSAARATAIREGWFSDTEIVIE
jgi:DNA helicase-2/ATP-dependent DNA helicase PcrA